MSNKSNEVVTITLPGKKKISVEAVQKAINAALSEGGRIKAKAASKNVDLSGDGIFDASALSQLVKNGSVSAEIAKRLRAVKKLHDAIRDLGIAEIVPSIASVETNKASETDKAA